jgi:hypothetical protein
MGRGEHEFKTVPAKEPWPALCIPKQTTFQLTGKLAYKARVNIIQCVCLGVAGNDGWGETWTWEWCQQARRVTAL